MIENNELSKDQAKQMYEQGVWKTMTKEQQAKFQMLTERLCMPFDVFHEAVEETLGREVYTHEFGMNWDGLLAEMFEGAKPPTLIEIIEMIPKEKQIFVIAPDKEIQNNEYVVRCS